MNELFIKYYENEPTLQNGNFTEGTSSWTINGEVDFYTNYGYLYFQGITATTNDYSLIYQPCILKTGNYKLEFTVTSTPINQTPVKLNTNYVWEFHAIVQDYGAAHVAFIGHLPIPSSFTNGSKVWVNSEQSPIYSGYEGEQTIFSTGTTVDGDYYLRVNTAFQYPYEGYGLSGKIIKHSQTSQGCAFFSVGTPPDITLNNCTPNIYNVGKYTYYLNCNNTSFGLQFFCNQFWNLGITNITLTLLDGSWSKVDLLEDYTIPLNYKILNLKDPSKRETTTSNTIVLPGTKENNLLFQHLYQISIYDSFEMNKKYECYLKDDSTIFFEGFLELMKVNTGNRNNFAYEAVITGKLMDFWEAIKDKYITDLDFSEYDHKYSLENIVNAFTITGQTIQGFTQHTGTTIPGEGYTYAMIDRCHKYHDDPWWSNVWLVDTWTPCLFHKEIVDKIFEYAGYEYDSTFFNTDTFKRLVYPATDYRVMDIGFERYFRGYDQSWVNDFLDSNTNEVLIDQTLIDVYQHSYYIKTSNNIQTFKIKENLYTTTNTNGYITINQSGYYNIKGNLSFDAHIYFTREDSGIIPDGGIVKTIGYSIGYNCGTYVIRSGGTTNLIGSIQGDLYASDPEMKTISTTSLYLNEWEEHPTLDYSIDEILYLREGDIIYINVVPSLQFRWSKVVGNMEWGYKYDSKNVRVLLQLWGKQENFITIEADQTITDGMTMKMNRILHPNIKMSDYMMSLVKMFNLYIEQTTEKTFKIDPYETFYNNYSQVVDLTDYVDFKSYSFERPQEFTNVNLWFHNDEDIDGFNTSYKESTTHIWGEKRILKNKSFEDTEIKTIFAGTPTAPISNPTNILLNGVSGKTTKSDISHIYKTKDDGTQDTEAKFKPRILYWNGWTATKTLATGNQEFFKVYSNDRVYWEDFWGYYPYAGHFDKPFGLDTFDLNFGSNDWYWCDMNGTGPTANNLYNLYHRNMIESLLDKDSRLVEFSVLLTTRLMKQIQFYNPIRIDNILYRLVSIDGFVPNEICKIKLLKLPTPQALGFSRYNRWVIENISQYHLQTYEQHFHIDVVDGGLIDDIFGLPDPAIHIGVVDGGLVVDSLTGLTGEINGKSKQQSSYFIDVIDAGNISEPAAAATPLNIYEIKNGPVLSRTQQLKKQP